MSLFPRFIASDFAPMFRMLDSYADHVASRGGVAWPSVSSTAQQQSFKAWQPRFDVKENADAYELHGELPGIQHEDINIEFTDAQTLSIKGRTESRREEGTRPSAFAALTGGGAEGQGRITDGQQAVESWSSTPTGTYRHASVEDETATSGANPDATSAAPSTVEEPTPATTESTTVSTTTTSGLDPTTPWAKNEGENSSDKSTYWLSERSVGSFSRSFGFPDRVDQDRVKASLKNGILSIIVPKAAPVLARRIAVE